MQQQQKQAAWRAGPSPVLVDLVSLSLSLSLSLSVLVSIVVVLGCFLTHVVVVVVFGVISGFSLKNGHGSVVSVASTLVLVGGGGGTQSRTVSVVLSLNKFL